MGLLDFLTKTIGVDPGSQNLRLIHESKIIFNETTQLSFDVKSNKVTGYGNDSKNEGSNKAVKPIDTAIADFYGFETLLRGSLKKTFNSRSLFPTSYKMYFTLPISTTEAEKRAYRDSGEHAGAIEVFMVYQPFCAAISMGILNEKKDFVLIDFGASKVEITVFGNSLPIAKGAIRIGIWKLKNALRNYIFRNYMMNLDSLQLESILFDLPGFKDSIRIGDKTIKSVEFKEVLNPYFLIIEDHILETLEKAGNHKNIDKIILNGFYFTGGGSQVRWLTEKLALNGKMKIEVSSNAFLDNINGLKKVLQNPEHFRNYIMI